MNKVLSVGNFELPLYINESLTVARQSSLTATSFICSVDAVGDTVTLSNAIISSIRHLTTMLVKILRVRSSVVQVIEDFCGFHDFHGIGSTMDILWGMQADEIERLSIVHTFSQILYYYVYHLSHSTHEPCSNLSRHTNPHLWEAMLSVYRELR